LKETCQVSNRYLFQCGIYSYFGKHTHKSKNIPWQKDVEFCPCLLAVVGIGVVVVVAVVVVVVVVVGAAVAVACVPAVVVW
jgi:hypothetical protein